MNAGNGMSVGQYDRWRQLDGDAARASDDWYKQDRDLERIVDAVVVGVPLLVGAVLFLAWRLIRR